MNLHMLGDCASEAAWICWSLGYKLSESAMIFQQQPFVEQWCVGCEIRAVCSR